MPRRRSAPRLYLDKSRGQWVIRDGAAYVRTGCPERDTGGAERALIQYLGSKHVPAPSAAPAILDVLTAYSQEHVPHKRSAAKIDHTIRNLARWWDDKRLADVTAKNCRAYAAVRPQAAARRDLETLRAAINHWHKEYGPLPAVPFVTLPEKSAPRERWLTRSEAARLLWAARRVEHLRRFILLGLYTGSRAEALMSAKWDWIDLETGLMRRRAPGTTESTKRTPPVRLQSGILAHVRRWRRADLALEPRGSGGSFVVHYLGDRIRKLRRSWLGAVARAGLSGKVTPHTLRHTRATWLMRDGVRLWDAAQQLGMSATVLERTYGHHAEGYQERR